MQNVKTLLYTQKGSVLLEENMVEEGDLVEAKLEHSAFDCCKINEIELVVEVQFANLLH